MPDLYVPVLTLPSSPDPPHPRADAIEAQAYTWALERGLVDREGYRRLAASRVVTAGTGYFDGGDPQILDAVARWYVWLVLVDDYVDDELFVGDVALQHDLMERFVDDLAAVFAGGPREPSHPLVVAVAGELWPQVAAGGSRAWRQRFAEHCLDCVRAISWNARVRSGVTAWPDLPAYVNRRRTSIGARMFCDMLSVIGELTLDESFYRSSAHDELVSAVCDVAGWINDIFSVSKDVADGEANLVLILHQRGAGSLEESVRDAGRMIDERVRHFDEVRAGLSWTMRELGLDDDALRQADYLAGRLSAMIRACYDCHVLSARWSVP